MARNYSGNKILAFGGDYENVENVFEPAFAKEIIEMCLLKSEKQVLHRRGSPEGRPHDSP